MKYVSVALFTLFIPHIMVWITVVCSAFVIDYKSIFNSEAFWATAITWWAIAERLGGTSYRR
jgi:hypothetical protein